MNRLILISAVCMQFGWISGIPRPSGVGAYAYQDSNGNSRRVARSPFFPPLPPLPPLRPFEPFRPLPPLQPLRPAFNSNTEYQRRALDTAKKAYDITSNQAGFMNLDFSRFAPFGRMPGFDNFGSFGNSDNSAFASGVAAPGFTRQVAAISPDNPNMPNVDVTQRFADVPGSGGNYMSVSSYSSSSSTNKDGVPSNHRIAETTVNNNGKMTHYKVEN